MASNGLDIARAGWLYRRSAILHRWKKNWFVLDRQGDLRYFESPGCPRAEERIVVRASVLSVKAGPDCRRYDPPEGLTISRCGFLELVLRDSDTMVLCADTFDEMKAWQIAIEEARTFAMPSQPMTTTFVAPPSYVQYPSMGFFGGGYYPGQVITTPGTQVIHGPSGTTTISSVTPAQQVVYIDNNRHRYQGGMYRRNYYW